MDWFRACLKRVKWRTGKSTLQGSAAIRAFVKGSSPGSISRMVILQEVHGTIRLVLQVLLLATSGVQL